MEAYLDRAEALEAAGLSEQDAHPGEPDPQEVVALVREAQARGETPSEIRNALRK